MSSSFLEREPGRRRALIIAGALLVLSIAIWVSPPIQHWSKGPSKQETELATERARSEDLKRQVDELSARAAEPRPPGTDGTEQARADDLQRQLDDAEANLKKPRPTPPDKAELARIEDLHRQLEVAKNKLEAPRPPVVDAAEKARADDLKARNDQLSEELSRPRPTVVPPVVAAYSKQDIVGMRNLWGLYTRQSPFDYGEVNLIQSDVQRRANLVGYFQAWTDPFRADALEETWRRNEIPLMTWEPQPHVGVVTADAADYNLPTILSGRYDDYIRSYARGIHDLGLPVVIRLAHEMNGNWYPWSETTWDGSSVNGNHRGEYALMWRHVHDIFESESANNLVIWLWSPNRVNQIPSQPLPVEFYPGDTYVDWIGMSGYYRPYDDAPSFADTFGKTLPLLRATSSRPIFLAETGATEINGHKAEWIHDLFRQLAANPDIVGFGWFSLTVTSSVGEGGRQTNDWRIDSSGSSVAAVKEELAASGYGFPL